MDIVLSMKHEHDLFFFFTVGIETCFLSMSGLVDKIDAYTALSRIHIDRFLPFILPLLLRCSSVVVCMVIFVCCCSSSVELQNNTGLVN